MLRYFHSRLCPIIRIKNVECIPISCSKNHPF